MQRLRITGIVLAATATIMVCSFPIYSFAQSTDILINHYTPNGTPVYGNYNNMQLNPVEIAAVNSMVYDIFPNVIVLGPYSNEYNCHGYAWIMHDGGPTCNYSSLLSYPTDSFIINEYTNDRSYIISSADDNKARKILYHGNDHSAVVYLQPTSNMVISKWGKGYLVRHGLYYCPYYDNNTIIRYYKLAMEIEGDEYINLSYPGQSVSRTYQISNLPKNASVNWSINSANGQISMVNNDQSVTLSLMDNATLRATVTTAEGLSIELSSMDIRVTSAPIVTDILMFQYLQEAGEYTFQAICNHSDSEFTWFVSGEGPVSIYNVVYPEDAIFLEAPTSFIAMSFSVSGYYDITVRSNHPGSTLFSFYTKRFYISII